MVEQQKPSARKFTPSTASQYMQEVNYNPPTATLQVPPQNVSTQTHHPRWTLMTMEMKEEEILAIMATYALIQRWKESL